MKNILILSSIILAAFVIISCNKDEPDSPDCDSLYPAYGGTTEDETFIFKWCPIENATKYHIQVSTSEDFTDIPYDTIVEEISVKSTLFVPFILDSTIILEHSPFIWGTNYYWRIASIENTTQKEWSDTYEFQTKDIRDDIVGIYEAKKTGYIKYSHTTAYYDSVYSVHEITVEKVPNTRGIRIKDNTYGDFDVEFNNNNTQGYFWQDFNSDSDCTFKINTDSFAIHRIVCHVPCAGRLYSGRH